MGKWAGFVSALLLIAGIDVWIMLWGDSAVEFGFWPVSHGVTLPPGLMPLLGVIIGASAVILFLAIRGHWRPANDDEGRSPIGLRSIAAGVVSGTASIFLALAVRDGNVPPLTAAAFLICGLIAFGASAYAFDAIRSGDGIRFDTYWGGLGGGQGGWRISRDAVILVIALVFLAATVTIGTGRGVKEDDQANAAGTASPKSGGVKGGGPPAGDKGGTAQ